MGTSLISSLPLQKVRGVRLASVCQVSSQAGAVLSRDNTNVMHTQAAALGLVGFGLGLDLGLGLADPRNSGPRSDVGLQCVPLIVEWCQQYALRGGCSAGAQQRFQSWGSNSLV